MEYRRLRTVLPRFFLRPLPKSQWLAISLAATAVLITLLWYWWKRQQAPPFPVALPVVVEVQGNVHHPGVFMLDAPVTVMQVVAAAGGSICDHAPAIQRPFYQQTMFTGERLQVACSGEGDLHIEIATMTAVARLTLGLKLDLNEASAADLALLPGMQPHWVEAIVERRSRQAWRGVSELQEITGIGPRTVERWANHLDVLETGHRP
jgi:DNA uptake protein ComE-like DNA-binding protein